MTGAMKNASTPSQPEGVADGGPPEIRLPNHAATAGGRAVIASARNVPSGGIPRPPRGAIGAKVADQASTLREYFVGEAA